MTKDFPRVAMVGFGEAGQAFVTGWGDAARGRTRACDLRAGDPAMQDAAASHGVECGTDPATALADAGAAFCLVTADQALAAAIACAPHLPEGAFWLDGNSCAPGTKRAAAEVIERAGGRYVDLAIMAPVYPRLHRTPGLLAGPNAAAAFALGQALGMDWQVVGERIGDASAIKMLRSVMIKGLEALSAECLLAARRAGVETEVLASLQASDPGWNWRARGTYNLERMIVHGARRAAEMREVAATLRELGLPDAMAQATAGWQDRIAGLHLTGGDGDLVDRADRILASLAPEATQ
ncbi:6-phosphogluconate dehydrogenase [Gemmobacter aquaticus]|uniref:6-phosphogluconate dehydrogenase n=1 Tax=Gemmobacter aquaticus TaxID=490185 RepID=A0A917YNA7_9RHOB|nr:NAD(P)-dependent oxidoreductase [Gemmobacter aquaticus]GGO38412.1 6-phosphogluconate dehydrogenase [Gemmobacter aquaticus]